MASLYHSIIQYASLLFCAAGTSAAEVLGQQTVSVRNTRATLDEQRTAEKVLVSIYGIPSTSPGPKPTKQKTTPQAEFCSGTDLKIPAQAAMLKLH